MYHKPRRDVDIQYTYVEREKVLIYFIQIIRSNSHLPAKVFVSARSYLTFSFQLSKLNYLQSIFSAGAYFRFGPP